MNVLPLKIYLRDHYAGTQLALDFFSVSEPIQTAKVIPFGLRTEWDDSAVKSLRDSLLWHSLRILEDGRAGQTAKRDVLDWIVSEELHPFSFNICCAEVDLDPEQLRERLIDMLARNKRKQERGAAKVSAVASV